MKIRTQREAIRESLALWRDRYPVNGTLHGAAWDTPAKRKAMHALDPETCTLADVEALAPGWGKLDCDECNESVEILIHFGDEPDYDARWWYVCASCLSKAATLLTGNK